MARTKSAEGGAEREGATGRVPPHDLEVEKAVLSALLLDNQAIHSVLTEVKPDDFYHPSHQQLYQAMLALQDENEPVDLHTLSDYLTRQKRLDAIGGVVFLAEIADYEATAANVIHHARIVREHSIKRSLIRVATEIVEAGYERGDRADHMLDAAESRIFEISRAKSQVTFRSLHDEMNDALNYVESLMARGGQLTGVPTGFRDLDQDTGGLQPGELVIIAARPSMGKTALALNIARNAAVDHGKKVAIFSLEMTKRSLALRLLASEARVDLTPFRRGYGSVDANARLVKAAGQLAARRHLDRRQRHDHDPRDQGEVPPAGLGARPRPGAASTTSSSATATRPTHRKDLEIAEISHGLKSLAKELDIPVIALSQLNRGPEQRDPDKRRPNMGDLRESGAIEQDADVVSFIYRDEVYNRTEENKGIAELIVAKQRNGPTGTIHLQFEARYATFRDLSAETRQGLGLPAEVGFARDEAPREIEEDVF